MLNNFSTNPPPRYNAPVVHNICDLYKNIYLFSSKISKRDRYGIYLKIENSCLDSMELLIEAALETKPNKLAILLTARIKIEKLKRLFGIMNELNLIETKKYIDFEFKLQEISRMTNNWIKSLMPKY